MKRTLFLLVFVPVIAWARPSVPASASPESAAPSRAPSTRTTGEPGTSYEVQEATANARRLISKAYGFDDAYRIEGLSFVFHVQDGRVQLRREYTWDIADNRVEYRGRGPTGLPIEVTYHRDRLADGDATLNATIDKWFVDDQFWLLFPFHLSWEKRLITLKSEPQRMRIQPGPSDCLIVQYPEGSSTAGDVYEVYYTPDHLIREWAYLPNGSNEPKFATTWERNAKAGPFIFSMAHRARDGALKVWFERVSVKLAGEGWVDAVPLEPTVSMGKPQASRSREPL
jgi:hypothetical protein